MRRLTPYGLLAIVLLTGLSMRPTPVRAGGAGQSAKPPAAKPQKAGSEKKVSSEPGVPGPQAQYIGSEACQACHEDIYKKFEATPHWKTMLGKVGGIGAHGCESCHGPGSEHVAGGGDVTKILNLKKSSGTKVAETCLTCHQYSEEHANFVRSAHKANDVSCIQCHSIHAANVKQFLLVKKQPELCYTCHADKKAEFSRPFRHRVNENLVRCTDCHNQHGGFLTRQLRATSAQDTTCFKCHTDKAGPFVFEHPPVKIEGCVSCHLPHGSSNPRLLKRSQVNLLCLECHTFTSDTPVPGIPTFHNQAQKYQSCTMCHVNIHGSNHSKVFFR